MVSTITTQQGLVHWPDLLFLSNFLEKRIPEIYQIQEDEKKNNCWLLPTRLFQDRLMRTCNALQSRVAFGYNEPHADDYEYNIP